VDADSSSTHSAAGGRVTCATPPWLALYAGRSDRIEAAVLPRSRVTPSQHVDRRRSTHPRGDGVSIGRVQFGDPDLCVPRRGRVLGTQPSGTDVVGVSG
jgi:hypothetical protein